MLKWVPAEGLIATITDGTVGAIDQYIQAQDDGNEPIEQEPVSYQIKKSTLPEPFVVDIVDDTDPQGPSIRIRGMNGFAIGYDLIGYVINYYKPVYIIKGSPSDIPNEADNVFAMKPSTIQSITYQIDIEGLDVLDNVVIEGSFQITVQNDLGKFQREYPEVISRIKNTTAYDD